MKELELTSNAALTDAVYETALNGSFLEVKLVAGCSNRNWTQSRRSKH